MHGLVHAQTLAVGPVQHGPLEARHLLGIVQRHELYVFRAATRVDLLEQGAQRKTHPGNHHRPGFHAAEAIDTLLQRSQLEDIVHVEGLRLIDLTFDPHGPGPRLERAGVFGRVLLVGAEFVEVVVGRDLVPGRQRLVRLEGEVRRCRQPGGPSGQRHTRQTGGRDRQRRPQERAAALPDLARGDFILGHVGTVAHVNLLSVCVQGCQSIDPAKDSSASIFRIHTVKAIAQAQAISGRALARHHPRQQQCLEYPDKVFPDLREKGDRVDNPKGPKEIPVFAEVVVFRRALAGEKVPFKT